MYNISANTIFTGKTLVYLPTCHSTNEHAISMLANENPLEGTVVITSEQTAGKGQRGSSWEAQPGQNLTFSLIYKPGFLSISHQFYLNVISSLAVRDTVAEFLHSDVKVKWPNDIYLTDKKIAGILIQNSLKKNNFSTSVIGIGLNVNQTAFSDKKAISMANYSGKSQSLEKVLNFLLEKIEQYYLMLRENRKEELFTLYNNHLYRLNENHVYKTDSGSFEGIITGVDENGRLLIKTAEEVRIFNFKEVAFVF